MEKMLGNLSSHDLPEPGHVKPHALHEEDAADRKAAKARKSKEMLGEEALKLNATINGIDIRVQFNLAQKGYVLSFPGAKGNALEIGNSAADARELFGKAVGLAANEKGIEGIPNMMKELKDLALELNSEPLELDEEPEAPEAAVATVVETAVETPKSAPQNELAPGMKEILAEERARQMQEGNELLNRESATERGARILQERFFAIDEKLITQDVALAARERAVQSRLGKFFAGAVGLAANAWDSAKAFTKGMVVEGGGALVDVFKPTEGGAMRRFVNFAFDDAMIGTALSMVGKEDAYNQAKLEGLEERLREKTAHEAEVARVAKEKAEAIAALHTEKYGTATPGIAQRFSVWREERNQKKELARLSKAETEAARKEAAIELAQAFAARGGDAFSEEEAETIGMKLLENEEIADVVDGMWKSSFGGAWEIVRSNLMMLRLISKIFTTERFAATNFIGSRVDKALRSKEEQADFEQAQSAQIENPDDERVVGWVARNIVGGITAGARALRSAIVTVGSSHVGGKEINYDAEPKELSLAEKLFPTVFSIRDRMALRNAEIQARTVESSVKTKGRMRKAYEGVMFAVNAAREGRISNEMLENNPELVANLRKALQDLEESRLEEITEKDMKPLDDVEQSA